MARVGPGSRVLDVAAGAGEQSLAAARRVGPTRPRARHRHRAGDARATPRPTRAPPAWPNVETRELDGEALDTLPAGVVRRRHQPRRPDLLSRPAARAGRHAPRAASRAGASRRSSTRRPSATPFFSIPVTIIRRARAAAAAAAGPAGAVLARRRRRARQRRSRRPGFRDDRGAQRVDSPVRLPSAAECVRFERESFGALHQMMAGLDEAERAETWARDRSARCARFETARRLRRPVRDAGRRRDRLTACARDAWLR